MAYMDEIKKVILDVAGNPESGIVAEYAEKWAKAIVELDSKDSQPAVEKAGTSFESVEKETRVTKPTEKR